MPLKKSEGNMYPWVTHVHTHLRGRCPHECAYCYVQKGAARLSGRYEGPVGAVDREFDVKYGEGKTIFVEHCTDLFAKGIDDGLIGHVLSHCRQWPRNTYVFQTKNPLRMARWNGCIPTNAVLGVTIESDLFYPTISRAPHPLERFAGAMFLGGALSRRLFVTIEPILYFSSEFFPWLASIPRLEFVNVGADSKNCGLSEPRPDHVRKLINLLRSAKIEVREKANLARLCPPEGGGRA